MARDWLGAGTFPGDHELPLQDCGEAFAEFNQSAGPPLRHALLGGMPLTDYGSAGPGGRRPLASEEHDRLRYAELETVTLGPLRC